MKCISIFDRLGIRKKFNLAIHIRIKHTSTVEIKKIQERKIISEQIRITQFSAIIIVLC